MASFLNLRFMDGHYSMHEFEHFSSLTRLLSQLYGEQGSRIQGFEGPSEIQLVMYENVDLWLCSTFRDRS